MPLKLIIHGAAGRMGREVVNAAASSPDFQIVGAVTRPGSPSLGLDAGVIAGVGPLGVPITDDLEAALKAGDVALDFSNPTAAVELATRAAAVGLPHVIGTTGLSPEQLGAIREGAARSPVLIAANLSPGINLLARILPEVARALGDEYDVELIEAHHRHKKDAPSGTAILLGDAVASALGRSLTEVERHGRHGISPRQPGEIGVHAIRGGGIAGEHTVLFIGEGEQVELSHQAFSRRTFALGALRAARFIAQQPPGLYTMQDVLK